MKQISPSDSPFSIKFAHAIVCKNQKSVNKHNKNKGISIHHINS